MHPTFTHDVLDVSPTGQVRVRKAHRLSVKDKVHVEVQVAKASGWSAIDGFWSKSFYICLFYASLGQFFVLGMKAF